MTREELCRRYMEIYYIPEEPGMKSLHEIFNEMTMIYTNKDDKYLADKMVKKTEEETGKVLSEEEKERIWKLVVGAAQG